MNDGMKTVKTNIGTILMEDYWKYAQCKMVSPVMKICVKMDIVSDYRRTA